MTIEKRLVHDLGVTTNPEHAVWLLTDGTLVNGSHEGRQRDVDHHEIGSYFKKSKKETGYDPYLYMAKFMRRGNIRWGCSETGLAVEFIKMPTRHQLDVMLELARNMPQSAFKHGPEWHDFDWLMKYIRHYCREPGYVYLQIEEWYFYFRQDAKGENST